MSEQIGFEKDYGHGILGKVVQDDSGSGDGPDVNSSFCKMVVLHRRYINPCKGLMDTPEEIAEWAKDNRDWQEFPLFMYDHGNTVYEVSESGKNPFSCPWDSGRVGSLFINKKESAGYRKKGAAAQRFKNAQAVAEEYTDWANGNVWGYVVYTDDDELDSCWGFIGDPDADYIIEAMDSAAADHTTQAKEKAEQALICTARKMEASRPDMYQA